MIRRMVTSARGKTKAKWRKRPRPAAGAASLRRRPENLSPFKNAFFFNRLLRAIPSRVLVLPMPINGTGGFGKPDGVGREFDDFQSSEIFNPGRRRITERFEEPRIDQGSNVVDLAIELHRRLLDIQPRRWPKDGKQPNRRVVHCGKLIFDVVRCSTRPGPRSRSTGMSGVSRNFGQRIFHSSFQKQSGI